MIKFPKKDGIYALIDKADRANDQICEIKDGKVCGNIPATIFSRKELDLLQKLTQKK